jgi:superfamily II DNA helicase RecQ
MSYKPVVQLDEARIRRAEDALCRVFNVPGLRDYQRRAGQNMLKGIHTILDIPTGGGKTLAFWYALFYYWIPDVGGLKKIVMVVGPLVALMQSQAAALVAKGIPSIAVTGSTERLKDVLKVGV